MVKSTAESITQVVRPERLDSNGSSSKVFITWTFIYFLLALLALILVGVWISNTGGLGWGDPLQVQAMMNNHVLMSMLGVLVFLGHTSILYRLFPNGNMTALKWTHGILQLTAWLFLVLAAYAGNFAVEYNVKPDGAAAVHYKSVHSWVAIITLTIMTLQWLCGFFGLLVPSCKGERRAAYKDVHIFTGNATLILACVTILVGIEEMRPTSTLLNVTSLIVVTFAVIGAYLLQADRFKPRRKEGYSDLEETAPLAASGRGQSYN